jgi:hypothetical protein
MRGAAMKMGQILSMDTGDLLPRELADILARLRSDARAMPIAQLEAAMNAAGTPADALTALNAVRAELATKFPGGTYDAFVAGDFATDPLLLSEIILEKYKTLNGQTEAWNDMTRLGNPFGLSPIQGSEFPQRFLYPQSEVNANENIPNPLPSLFAPTSVNQ